MTHLASDGSNDTRQGVLLYLTMLVPGGEETELPLEVFFSKAERIASDTKALGSPSPLT